MSNSIRIVEVGPRDGLQNIKQAIPIDFRTRLINQLLECGLKEIEIGAFVSEKWVPQMAGTEELCGNLKNKADGLSVLVPNRRGLEAFLKSGLTRLAFFSAVSEEFNRKNTNKSVEESFALFKELAQEASSKGFFIRFYLSTVFHCPFQGRITARDFAKVLEMFRGIPIDDLSLGDTTGMAHPEQVKEFTRVVLNYFPLSKISYHFHDTYGMALCNVHSAVEQGVRSFDASVSGLGGCPYAPGSSGNLATEDLVHYSHSLGFETGVDLVKLCHASVEINGYLNRQTQSRAQAAILSRHVNTHG